MSPFPAASTGPLPSKCHEAWTANPRPILAATGARDFECTENLGGPLVQYIDFIVDVPVVKQRQALLTQTVQKTLKVPQIQRLHREDERSCSGRLQPDSASYAFCWRARMVLPRWGPMLQKVKKTAEIPHVPFSLTECLMYRS